jgi:transposase
MLSFSGSLKIFLAIEPCDMRKGFNGLHGLVSERLGEEVKSGALYVFTNRRRKRATFTIPITKSDHKIPVASATW